MLGSEVLVMGEAEFISFLQQAKENFAACYMSSGSSQTVALGTSSAHAVALKELHAFSKSRPGAQECVLGTGTSRDQAHLCASGWCCHKLHVGISSRPCCLCH